MGYPRKEMLTKAFDEEGVEIDNDDDPRFGLRFWKTGQEIKDSLTVKINGLEVERTKVTTAGELICKKNGLTFSEVLEEDRTKMDFVTRLMNSISDEESELSGYANKAQTSVMGIGMKDRKNELQKLNQELMVIQQLSTKYRELEHTREYLTRIATNLDAGARFMLTAAQLAFFGF